MQPPASITRRSVGVAVALGAVLLTASCAAGQDTATSEIKPAIDAAIGTVGSIDLRGVAILPPIGDRVFYPAGDNAPLTMVIVNSGTSADTLTAVASPAASGFQFAPGDVVLLPTASPSLATAGTTAAAPSPTGTATGSGTGTPTGSTTATATATPAIPQTVTIPAGSPVSFGVEGSSMSLFLTTLRAQLNTAAVIPITFTFQNSGSVTIQVPVQLSSTPGSSTIPVGSSAAD